ncbi:glycoside hydrolase family 18 protein [Neptunicella marina]|uniref:chitinase n=1 Tax=Neptunicella marina TaxID=2125989 RepID=A0A8J6ISG7_9ALTE|nr:glycoside hydrolase family 18 protein [Neptunicella marina]MBC3765464.1 glycoside hydrolase family 18 protein [Neptunicella marina]
MRLFDEQNSVRLTTKLLICLALFVVNSVHAKQAVIASYYASDGNIEAIKQLPAHKLTHILYAFIAICGDNSGADKQTQLAIKKACKDKKNYSAVLFNPAAKAELDAFKQLKQQHAQLKVLPSFGGWILSQPFHDIVKTQDNLAYFVKSAVELIAEYDVFDGIDIDWEYPGGGGNQQPILDGAAADNERIQYTNMMKLLRHKMDQLALKTGRTYLLSAAVNGMPYKVNAIDWRGVIPYMDYVFAMTYDFAVGDGRAAHHTNLFSDASGSMSASAMLENLLVAGVPSQKLVMGAAFYGRGWTQSGWQGEAFADNSQSVSTGSYQYRELIDQPPAGYVYGFDKKAQAPYFYNSANDGFISFDDARSIEAKARWAKQKDLAGIFSWQIRQDNGDLLDAMLKGFAAKPDVQ